MNERSGWLPNTHQLSTEQINRIVKRKCMSIVTKEDLIGELQMEGMEETYRRELEASETEKFYKKMKKVEKTKK